MEMSKNDAVHSGEVCGFSTDTLMVNKERFFTPGQVCAYGHARYS